MAALAELRVNQKVYGPDGCEKLVVAFNKNGSVFVREVEWEIKGKKRYARSIHYKEFAPSQLRLINDKSNT
jgi:hypothetical protein